MTGIKDAYEDIKRHQSDRVVNFSEVHVLEGGGYVNSNPMAPKSKTFVRALTKRIGKDKLTKATVGQSAQALTNPTAPEALEKATPPPDSDTLDAEYDDDLAADHSNKLSRPHWQRSTWEDLRVGDFVKIFDHESIPADVLICATSEDENVAFVETKNLDGETNLKSRNAVPALTHLRNAPACADPKNVFRVECDRPEVLMHKLVAAVEINGERYPVDLQTTLLRGTVLRNTGWVIGIVMYTGLDTKLVLNSGGTPSKRGKVERMMNPMVLANLVILIIMAVICGVIDSVLEHHYYPKQAPWLFGDNRKGDNPSVNGLVTLLFAFITFVTCRHAAVKMWTCADLRWCLSGSRISSRSRSTSPSKLFELVKRHSSTLIRKCSTRKPIRPRWPELSHFPMILGKSNTFSRIRPER
jgi:phospholipid-translocating ATPase